MHTPDEEEYEDAVVTVPEQGEFPGNYHPEEGTVVVSYGEQRPEVNIGDAVEVNGQPRTVTGTQRRPGPAGQGRVLVLETEAP